MAGCGTHRGLEVEWGQWRLNEPGYKNQGKETDQAHMWGRGTGGSMLLEETETREWHDTGQFSPFPSYWRWSAECLRVREAGRAPPLCLPPISSTKRVPEG